MEWVQTTAKSVEEARERALDELGVDEQDAEFEVLEEPKSGLFGFTRGEARIRARVKPVEPPAKNERGRGRGRGRGGRSRGKGQKSDGGKGRGRSRSGSDKGEDAPAASDGESGDRGGSGRGGSGGRDRSRNRSDAQTSDSRKSQGNGGNRRRGGDGGRNEKDQGQKKQKSSAGDGKRRRQEENMSDMSIEDQGAAAAAFLDGLVDAFGLEGEASSTVLDDDIVEVDVKGDDLGLLIGPKGKTLWAVQELTKTVVQREAGGGLRGRIRLDVGGYRERRRVALADFTQRAAAAVLEKGVAQAMEPMGGADRKVIHDTVNEIDGVHTVSEGEDPNRRVVLVPDDE